MKKIIGYSIYAGLAIIPHAIFIYFAGFFVWICFIGLMLLLFPVIYLFVVLAYKLADDLIKDDD